MAYVIDTRMKQRTVIERLTAEGVSPIQVRMRPNNVYGEHAVNVSAVRRWVRHFKSGETEIGDKPLPPHFVLSSYSPDLATSDCHLFGLVKNVLSHLAMDGCHFAHGS
jgi:hypothetical protein